MNLFPITYTDKRSFIEQSEIKFARGLSEETEPLIVLLSDVLLF